MTHSPFSNEFLNFHEFIHLLVFSLLMILGFIAWWSGRIMGLFHFFSALLKRSVLCLGMCCVLENFPCLRSRMYIYLLLGGCSAVYAEFIWGKVPFILKYLYFWPDYLYIEISGISLACVHQSLWRMVMSAWFLKYFQPLFTLRCFWS